jgi:hypothetical protein
MWSFIFNRYILKTDDEASKDRDPSSESVLHNIS